MNIGIIGKGFVGTAISEGFKTQGHETICHDVRLETNIRDVLHTPITYICVPTPSAPNGDCDTSIVESVLQELYSLNYEGCVCVKSTVKPGSVDSWKKRFGKVGATIPSYARASPSHWSCKFTPLRPVTVIGIKKSAALNPVP